MKKKRQLHVILASALCGQLAYVCTDLTYDPAGSAFISRNSTQPNQSFVFHGANRQWQDLHDEKFYAYENGISSCIKAFMNDIDAADADEHLYAGRLLCRCRRQVGSDDSAQEIRKDLPKNETISMIERHPPCNHFITT